MPKPPEFPQPWLALSLRYGGAIRLAAKLSVHHSTLYRWANGLFAPDPANRAILSALFIKHNLPVPDFKVHA